MSADDQSEGEGAFPAIVVVPTGPPGVGKTHTLEQFGRCFAVAPARAERLFESDGLSSFVGRLWRHLTAFMGELFGWPYEVHRDDSIVGVLVSMGVPLALAQHNAARIAADGLSDDLIDELATRLSRNRGM